MRRAPTDHRKKKKMECRIHVMVGLDACWLLLSSASFQIYFFFAFFNLPFIRCKNGALSRITCVLWRSSVFSSAISLFSCARFFVGKTAENDANCDRRREWTQVMPFNRPVERNAQTQTYPEYVQLTEQKPRMAEQKYNFHRRLNELSDFCYFPFKWISHLRLKLRPNHFRYCCFFFARANFSCIGRHRLFRCHSDVSIVSRLAREACMRKKCNVCSSPNWN